MKPEPKRHHYIPQFILRNFQDENSQVSYWNIENSKLEKRNTSNLHFPVCTTLTPIRFNG